MFGLAKRPNLATLQPTPGLVVPSGGVQRADNLPVLGDDPVGQAHPVVVLAKVGGLVDDAGTRVLRDVAVAKDLFLEGGKKKREIVNLVKRKFNSGFFTGLIKPDEIGIGVCQN